MADTDPNARSLVDTGSSHAVPPDTNSTNTRADILAVLDLNGTLLDRVTNAARLEFLWDRSKCHVVGSGNDEELMKDLEMIWRKHERWNEFSTNDQLDWGKEGFVSSANGESVDVREWVGGTPFDALAVLALDDPSFSKPISTLATNLILGLTITTDDRGKVVRKTPIVGQPEQSFDSGEAEREGAERGEEKGEHGKESALEENKAAARLADEQQHGDSASAIMDVQRVEEVEEARETSGTGGETAAASSPETSDGQEEVGPAGKHVGRGPREPDGGKLGFGRPSPRWIIAKGIEKGEAERT
ncbi:hypothetical protein M427DRAFT_49093 [Gonapodya prolifera JEL478]|uniref:Uncharacterized protein n=1 Tax=Gonapodya prolifera (strain JEL478) TaxID=1344416 RepID=A0A138ZZ71_GONPJ|nr:hypothetical protein M427DRAFT_49093 [Gonapodya prolifera JEL478]|eukprot:KXS09806.1 hypothetical protein M427DRAFT_49093 [Gonapodya prolifera JEL478]